MATKKVGTADFKRKPGKLYVLDKMNNVLEVDRAKSKAKKKTVKKK